jgi:hypothetical protein
MNDLKSIPHEGKMGAPLSPQEWIEHYYKIEGTIGYFEETICSKDGK